LAAGPLEGPNGARVAPRHVRPLGPLDEAGLALWLARGPVFVSVARYEPFGLAVLEAALAGCALVLSDTPGFRELWDGAAIFVAERDDVALATVLHALLQDRERRAACGAAAEARARRYGVEAMTAGMLAVYRQVLHGAAQGTMQGAAA
ncbi:MAG TPA: glycosyltransferase, partial [Crenalkalicoccus sp.]|nr:glycosyltransferase [Crenalkalicoccus sp.]